MYHNESLQCVGLVKVFSFCRLHTGLVIISFLPVPLYSESNVTLQKKRDSPVCP